MKIKYIFFLLFFSSTIISMSDYIYTDPPYVLFNHNSVEYTENSYNQIEMVVQLLKDNPNIKIKILGKRDFFESDTLLGKKRAEVVKSKLEEKGINSERLVTEDLSTNFCNYDSLTIVKANDTLSNDYKQINRSVTFNIIWPSR